MVILFTYMYYVPFYFNHTQHPETLFFCNRTCFHLSYVISVLVSDNNYIYIDIYMHNCDYTFAAPDDNKLS